MIDATTSLNSVNVAIGLAFIAFNCILSQAFQLGISASLIVASLRCIVQLTIMAAVLDKVFASNNVYGIFGMVALLNVLGAVEVTFNKAKGRFNNMFFFILLSMLCATVPISILGTRFAMSQRPFWQPDQYIPIIGMILGNAISAIGVGWNTVQKEFAENRDKIEAYLALGASRFEACRPVAVGALKLALLPTINQLSVIGLISIPGMMTGAIVGGKPVDQAARLQMIIMFMIAASSALAVLFSLYFACTTVVDDRDRIRVDRIDFRKPAFYRWRDEAISWSWNSLKKPWGRSREANSERQGLLDNSR